MFDFLNQIRASMVMTVLKSVFALLPQATVRDFIFKMTSKARSEILGTASTIDDERILPIIDRLDIAVDIKDNSEIITALVTFLLRELPELIFDSFMDFIFDYLEELVENSTTKVDDAIILPLIATARVMLDVPDGD